MKLWVTAGGTGSAWHICQIAKQYFKEEIELFVSDINAPELVAAATLADHFFVVPPVKQAGYQEYMYDLLKQNQIDVIIPLIPWEQPMFSMDYEPFARLGIQSLAPEQKTSEELNHKISLYEFCKKHEFPTIQIYTEEQWNQMRDKISDDKLFFVKAKNGFGAMGAAVKRADQITLEDFQSGVVQEYCITEFEQDGVTKSELKEITVEVFWHNNQVHTIARRRIEAKSGVCTKAEILFVPEVEAIIQKMVTLLPFPKVFNVQFIYHEGLWKMMDVNLRLAAGTGLSNAAGFQCIRCLLASLLGHEIPEEWLTVQKDIKTVLRVYQEVVIR